MTFLFSVKRKTGSKTVINWISKFGHGISYDDVRVLETHLAIEHSKDQAQRSFIPSLIQPHRFVTFVWDNNDINPESIKGISMHCTNGIVIQKSHVPSSNQSTSETVQHQETREHRIKTFTAMTTQIPT